jgi:hypothetical protein
MTKRRARGDGGVHWDEQRQRFIASLTVGYDPAGKRIVRRGSGKTEAQARAKLKEVIRDYDDGLAIAPHNLTVAQVVTDWLSYGLNGRSPATVDKWTCLCKTHVIPALGKRKIRELSATDVDRWLADKAKTLSTNPLQLLHQCLNRTAPGLVAADLLERIEPCHVLVPTRGSCVSMRCGWPRRSRRSTSRSTPRSPR